MMHDVVTIGDAMRDIFLFPALSEVEKPVEGEAIRTKESFEEFLVFGLGDKITVSDVAFSVGGTANNVAVGLAEIGLKVSVCSALGDDNAGKEIEEQISKRGVDTSSIKIYHRKHSSFSVIISYKGERTIFVYHAFNPENFKLPENIQTQWAYLGPMAEGYDRIFNHITSLKVKNDLKVAINPGAVQIERGLHSFGGLLKMIDIIFLNREEAKDISGLKGVATVKEMARAIHLEGPKMVVITDGKDGAYAFDGVDFLKVGAYPGHRLDATGAGDAFSSAYLAAVINGEEMQNALKWGVTNSASVIEKIGAQEGLLSKGTIKRRVKEYKWPADTLRFS